MADSNQFNLSDHDYATKELSNSLISKIEYLKVLNDIFLNENFRKTKKKDILSIKGKRDLIEYLKTDMGDIKNEEFKIIYLNNDNKISKNSDDEKNKKEVKSTSKGSKERINTSSKNNVQEKEIEKLQEQLKEAIKEERYEDAAKIRDEINLMRKNQKN